MDRPLLTPSRPRRALRRPAALATCLAAALGALAPACGESQAGPTFHPIVRPPLVAAPDADPARPLVPWRTLEPAQGDLEVVQALRTEVVPDPWRPDAPGLLRLYNRDRKIAAADLTGSARADRIRLRIQIKRFDTLRVRWLRDGQAHTEVDVPLFPAPDPHDYVVEPPLALERSAERLEFVVLGEGPASLGRIELFELLGEHRLPRPGATPEFAGVGDDVRPVYGLAPRRPLEVRFEAVPGGILVASAAVPPRLRIAGDAPILSVYVHGQPGGLRVHRYPLVESDAASSGWVWVRVPLDAAGDGLATARFQLESAHPDDAVCALTQPQIVRFDERAPTVLLVTSDTHRGDHVGYAQNGVPVRTPVLDRLARRGVVFADAWAPTNVTIPSHASILTGLSLRDTGILDNMQALSAEARTLAEAFAEAGWATVAAVSASHLDADWSGLGQGFDRMAVSRPAKRSAGETLAHVERWLGDYRGRPLFAWLHLFDAHAPYAPPPPLVASAWDPAKDPRDPRLSEPDPRLVPKHLSGIRDLDYVVAQYRGEVNYLDSELARLLDRSRFRDAIVAFTADHGESFGSHGVYWDHGGLYRDRLHVPLVLAWPTAPAGRRVAERVSILDVGRTLLDLAGLAAVEHPGSNLLARGSATVEPHFAIACFGFSASIVDGDDLLILHLAEHELHNRSLDGRRERHAVELYDLASDPECVRELSVERRGRTAELRARLVAWLQAGQGRGWRSTPVGSVDVLANLSALGYAGGSTEGDDGRLFPSYCECARCLEFAR
ncbi:MAG: sulfatase [Planctomycetes bacterium]|nr:sulfatase [Planctomycetota bacterium]